MKLTKTSTAGYIVPIDFNLPMGETIKSVSISSMTGIDCIIHSSNSKTVELDINGGTTGNVYNVSVMITTNIAGNRPVKSINVIVDDSYNTPKFEDIKYNVITDTNDIIILIDKSTPLHNNTEYDITLYKGLIGSVNTIMTNNYSFWFTSKYCPMFTTPTKVRMLAGPSIDMYSDDTLNRYIYRNSLFAIDVYNLNTGSHVPYDYFGCGPEDIPELLSRFVECKTAYDTLSILSALGASGNQKKTLGDMTISYGSATNTTNTSDPKPKLYDCYNSLLNRIGKGLDTAIRGVYDTTKGHVHPIMNPNENRVVRPIYGRRNATPGTKHVRTF